MEEDEENDVELKRTMWLIIRKKRSVNEVLKDFFPDYQQQVIRVRDIIKFGRVNFKISALHCDRIDPTYTGSCYKPPQTDLQDGESSGRLDYLPHDTQIYNNTQLRKS